MQYTNQNGTTIPLAFPEDTMMPRVPPVHALDGFVKEFLLNW
jgi:hypothetical protein